ncbi:MAG: DUF4221 domain-containing protein [Prevotella sp.]|jgi:hypothetical protein|nr:DUF4221 domain-containing protein [Prevotella sp.]
MNRYLKINLLLLCVVLTYSCADSGKKTSVHVNRDGQKLYTMQELPCKTFNMDENTSQIVDFFQPFIIDGTLRFTMHSRTAVRQCILVFDISTGNVIDSIPLYKQGPNAISGNFQGYYIHNMDSVYFFSHFEQNLFLVNRQGEVISKINLAEQFIREDNSKIVPSYPFPGIDTPIRKLNSTLILQGTGRFNDNPKDPVLNVTALYNLTDTTLKFANSYPEIYGDPNNIGNQWGFFGYLKVAYDLNGNGEMVLSYPADDHIAVYDIAANTSRRYFAGYSKKDIIRTISESDKDEAFQYLENTRYGNIHYDSYRNLYYRFVQHPLYDYDTRDRNTYKKDLSIIILDSEFNKVGEYDLKEKPWMSNNAFVSEEGLHIQTLSDDDDFMKFISLKPTRIND